MAAVSPTVASGTITATVPSGATTGPVNVLDTASGKMLNAGTFTVTLPGPQAVTVTASAPVTNWLLVGDYGTSNVTVLPLDATGTPSVPTVCQMPLGAGYGPSGMALDPTKDILFVAGPGNGVINTLSQLLPVVLTETATSLTLTPGTAGLTDSIAQSVCVEPRRGVEHGPHRRRRRNGLGLQIHERRRPLGSPAGPEPQGDQSYSGGPDSIVIAPSGKYLYTGVNADLSIYSLSLSSTGVGTWNSKSPTGDTYVGAGVNGPNSIVMNSAGTFLYAGCGNNDGTITSCNVSGLNVTQAFQVTASSGGNITGIAIDPTGTYLAAAINDSNSVALYSLTTTGTTAGNVAS